MNLRQRRFVDEYLIDLDGKHAAIRVGYAASDAKNRACRFLKTPAIANAIRAAMAERSRRTGITPERVLEELARIAFLDWRLLAEWGPDDVAVTESSTLSADAAAAVARVSTDDGWEDRVAVATHDKRRALDTLSRILGLSVGAPKPASRA
ncbi:MAG: terminase small subunit [Alphaproteobacteria bacterium]|nr:terminase small subunit [Alphaproteobacteria bacterium]